MLKPAVNSSRLSFIARRKEEVSSFSPIGNELFRRAGVGRTGTFIAIDAMIERIEREGTVNVYDCITQMRCERHFMVQTVVGLIDRNDVFDSGYVFDLFETRNSMSSSIVACWSTISLGTRESKHPLFERTTRMTKRTTKLNWSWNTT